MSAKDLAPDRLYTVQEADEICRRQSGDAPGIALEDVILLLLYADTRPLRGKREQAWQALFDAAGVLRESGVEPALLGEGGTALRGADIDDAVEQLTFSNKVRMLANKEGLALGIEITPQGKAAIKEKYESLPPGARKALSQKRAEWDATLPPTVTKDHTHIHSEAHLKGGARDAGPSEGQSGRRATEKTTFHSGAKDAKRQEYVDRGDRLCEEGRYDEAYAYYKQAEERGDPDADLHLRMARSMSEMKLYKEALDHCMAAIRADPARAGGYVGAGYCLNSLGRHAEALAYHQRATRLDPDHALAHQYASLSLIQLGRYEESLRHAEREAAILPRDPGAHARVATCLSLLGRHADAVPPAQKAIEAAPRRPGFYLPLVTSLLGMDHHEKVLEWCGRAIEADRRDPLMHSIMALSLRELGRQEEALPHCQKSIELDPSNPHFRAIMSHLLRDLGRQEEALPYCEAVVSAAPRDLPALSNMGTMLAELDRHDEALECFNRAIRIDPRQPVPRYNRALSLHMANRPRGALKEYKRVVALDPGNVGAYNNMGAVLATLGRDGEALAHFDRALELDPGNAIVHRNKAMSLQSLSLHREALAHFDRAYELDPGSAEAYVGRLSCLGKLGLQDEAIGRYAEALGPTTAAGGAGSGDARRRATAPSAPAPLRTPEPGTAAASDREQHVKSLLSMDESAVLEFKSWPGSRPGRAPESSNMEENIAKALCGLVNAEGGSLLIGVGDDGAVEGLAPGGGRRLSREERGNIVAWVTNVIVDYFGVQHDDCFDCKVVEADGLDILHCLVAASEAGPVTLKKRLGGKHDFFVRFRNTCRPLGSMELLDYVKKRWPEWSSRPQPMAQFTIKDQGGVPIASMGGRDADLRPAGMPGPTRGRPSPPGGKRKPGGEDRP